MRARQGTGILTKSLAYRQGLAIASRQITMNTWVDRTIGRVASLRAGEGTVATLLFAYSFLAMTAYNILKPLTRSKFIANLGSDNLPYIQLAAGFLIGLIMHAYVAGMRRVSRHRVIPTTLTVIILLLVAFSVLLRTGSDIVTVAFYVFGLILGVLLISQFWTLANDVYDARQAKRLFGLIGGGASLGGAVGSGLTAFVVQEVGADNLLLVSAGTLILCIAIVTAITRRHAVHSDATQQEVGVGGREALEILKSSRHIKLVALVVACASAGAGIIEQQLNMAAEATKGGAGADAIAAFLAQVTFLISIIGFVVQVAVTSRIHRSLGLLFALLLLPTALGSTAALILLTGAFWAPAVARVVDSTLRYTVDKTSREILFLPLSPELKYRAKPLIDVTMDRFARALAAVLLLVLIKPWGLGLDWRQLSFASIAVTGLWVATAFIARGEYLRSFRGSIDNRTLAVDTVRVNVADPATIETLVEELANPDAAAVLYAVGMLESMDRRHLISPLLLQHESPPVRARALLALKHIRPHIAQRWKPVAERLLEDPDVTVRAAAVRALADFAHEDATTVMRRHLNDPEPRIAVTAAVALANTRVPSDVAEAEAIMKMLSATVGDDGVHARTEVAAALAHVEPDHFRPLLVPLLYDSDRRVVEAAIRTARSLGPSDGLFVPALLSLLGNPQLKRAARDTLIGYGEEAVPALAHALADQREDPWIRRHVPATLAVIASQAALDALNTVLEDSDAFLRYKTIVAIERLHREHAELTFQTKPVEKLLLQETTRYYRWTALHHDVHTHTNGGAPLLTRVLAEKMKRSSDRIYRLLGLAHSVEDVRAARAAIEGSDSRRRAGGLEFLDNLLDATMRRRLLPILDHTNPADTLTRAYSILKTRPRDLADAVAQLVHEDDVVISAAAVHFAARHLPQLADDLSFCRERRPGDERVIEMVERIAAIPLFQRVSVDEVFRIAKRVAPVHYGTGGELPARSTAGLVYFLLDGAVGVRSESGLDRVVTAPAMIGLEHALLANGSGAVIRSIQPVQYFHIGAEEFITLLADSQQLTEGLFQLLLADRTFDSLDVAGDDKHSHTLRAHPLLAHASPGQLLALLDRAREIRLVRGSVVFDRTDPSMLYHVLAGELRLESEGESMQAGRAATLGLGETLAGVPLPWRATVTEEGRALRVQRDDLFATLADHVDLLRGIFAEIVRDPSPATLA